VRWLSEVAGAGPGRTVLDLGAGTGTCTTVIRDTGAPVIAVVVRRTLSVSFAAALPVEQQQAIERRFRSFIESEPAPTGPLQAAFPYVTAMFPLPAQARFRQCQDNQAFRMTHVVIER